MFRTITPIVSIVIAFTIFFSFTKPMFSEVKNLRFETEQYEKATADATALNNKLNELLTTKRSYSADTLERLEALVPTEIDEVHILADLSQVAKSHKMLLGNVTLGAGEGKRGSNSSDIEEDSGTAVSYDSLTSADITFEVLGTYEQFKSFLAEVEHSLVLLEVVDLSVTASESIFQQFSVTVRTYALPVKSIADATN